ncbi:MAG: hypothetical protein ABSF82_02285 [Candidatus Bathyarchaeia archaeon]|jgi:hypothetical protein
MGRRGKDFERNIDSVIWGIIRSHITGITFEDSLKEAEHKIGISRDTFSRHLNGLRAIGAVNQQGNLYSVSKVWALQDDSRQLRQRNLYPYLLVAVTSLTHRYLALLQAMIEAPDISKAHGEADRFLRNVDDSYIMEFARGVWKSRGNVRLEPLSEDNRSLTLEFVKAQRPNRGVRVRGISDRQAKRKSP